MIDLEVLQWALPTIHFLSFQLRTPRGDWTIQDDIRERVIVGTLKKKNVERAAGVVRNYSTQTGSRGVYHLA